jgi:tetratricopeptide (TPR) repeat protein
LSGNSHLPKDYLFFTILAVSATGIQNIFSVDMRFGISFGIFFMLLGLSVSEMEGPMFENKKLGDLVGMDLPARLSTSIVLSGFWLALMGFFIFPKLLKPYQAQKEVSSTPSFFDQRLLDPAKSILDLENLKAQYPKEPAILEKLAFVYAKEIKSADNKINLQNAEKAVQTYQELIQIDPKRVSAYNNTANIYYTMGHELEAIEFWEKAVHVDPTFLDAQLNLGKILYVKGELKESAAHFEKVLKLNPGNAEAIIYLKKMVE